MTLLQFEIIIFVLLAGYCWIKYLYEGYFYSLCTEEISLTQALFLVTHCTFMEKDEVNGEWTRYQLEFSPDVKLVSYNEWICYILNPRDAIWNGAVLLPKSKLLEIELQFDEFIRSDIIELEEDDNGFVPFFYRDNLKKELYETKEAAAARIYDYLQQDFIAQLLLGKKHEVLLKQYEELDKQYKAVCRVEPGTKFRMVLEKN